MALADCCLKDKISLMLTKKQSRSKLQKVLLKLYGGPREGWHPCLKFKITESADHFLTCTWRVCITLILVFLNVLWITLATVQYVWDELWLMLDFCWSVTQGFWKSFYIHNFLYLHLVLNLLWSTFWTTPRTTLERNWMLIFKMKIRAKKTSDILLIHFRTSTAAFKMQINK